MYNIYNLVDYNDVWGNPTDGWEVNDVSRTEEYICILDEATDEEIFNYLKQIVGYFKQDVQFNQIRFDWYDDYVCEMIETETDMPLGRLEFERRSK